MVRMARDSALLQSLNAENPAPADKSSGEKNLGAAPIWDAIKS
jgi:hypothetical protein